MTLNSFSAHNFRNFAEIQVTCCPDFNLLSGKNGAGKTNFLEAAYYLGAGRSFRCHLWQRLVRQHANSFLLHSTVTQHDHTINLGIQRSLQEKHILHVNGEKVTSIVELAKFLPIQVLNQDSYQLLTGGPKWRRRLLDWGVFHVEHTPLSLWANLERALLQRNASIKQKASLKQIQLWDNELVSSATLLHQLRHTYITKLKPLLEYYCTFLFTDLFKIELEYDAGWDTQYNLQDLLAANIARDLQLGFTHLGPHRADIKFHSDNTPIQDLLSRGQQKLFLLALRAAECSLLNQACNTRSILLIDDLAAELDDIKQAMTIDLLLTLDAQIFISINTKQLQHTLAKANSKKIKTFHVEQGNIQEIN